jgi:branched-chain amino acid transport system ATP-binding protein
MADAVLAVERLSLAFGGLKVLSEVSFSQAEGELLALIGPNGAGKTSVLNCVSGVYRPNAGRILLDGRDLVGRAPHAVARAGVARTFQHGELFARLTLVENLLVARHARMRSGLLADGLFLPRVRREEAEHRAAVERVLDFVELQRHRHKQVGGLPLGVQKLAGFARALAMEPRLLLLDEPSAGLNRQEKEDLARFLLRIKHEMSVPMLWVEHDMQMVADLADRLFVLNYGEAVTEGPPREVLADPRVVAAYMGKARAG